jgi:hypothetical protein
MIFMTAPLGRHQLRCFDPERWHFSVWTALTGGVPLIETSLETRLGWPVEEVERQISN